MADTGWLYAADARSIAGPNKDWTNPERAEGAADGNLTYRSVTENEETDYLNTYTYNASIPTNATINGIYVAIYRLGQEGSSAKDLNVHLMEDTSTKGNNKADGSTWYPTNLTWAYYGGASDLWGVSWTASQANAGTFGIGLKSHAPGGGASVRVDTVAVKIYYTVGVDIDHLMIMGM